MLLSPKVKIKRKRQLKKGYSFLAEKHPYQQCLKRTTQCQNKFLHAKLWLKCNKNKYAGLNMVKYAAQNTLLEHRFRYTSSLPVGTQCVRSTAYNLPMLKTQNEENGIWCYIVADIGKQGPPTRCFITPPLSKTKPGYNNGGGNSWHSHCGVSNSLKRMETRYRTLFVVKNHRQIKRKKMKYYTPRYGQTWVCIFEWGSKV